MPALVSSLVRVVEGTGSAAEVGGDRVCDLVEVLSVLPDPRHRQGRRFELEAVLGLALAAVIGGARSYRAIAEWVADLDQQVRRRFGAARVAPSAATIRRVVLGVDPDLLDAVLTAWLAARSSGHEDGEPLVCVAVDGKSARGARRVDGRPVHLVAAVEHSSGVVRGQVAVDAKSNEITAFVPLLDQLDLAGVVVTADAMHTQDGHARYLHRRGAHYVLIVKANRPTLARELAGLPWKDVKAAFTCTNTGHGRVETRTIKVVRPPRRLSFPHARQAIWLRRWRRTHDGKVATETVFAVTDLDFDQATPAQLAQIIRGHWTIENRVHHVRDVTFDEDRSQTRTAASAQVMATFRNVAISLHRLAGATTIAQATRAIMRHSERVLPLIT
jgi:predicted transposase YbfD/YdcC